VRDKVPSSYVGARAAQLDRSALMDSTHVHTVLTPNDYREARAYLTTRLVRMFLIDVAPFFIMAVLMAIALVFTLKQDNPSRLKLLVGLPGIVVALGLLRAILRAGHVAIHARRRFAQLEARTLAGEVITCAEIDEPFPIRPPSWLV